MSDEKKEGREKQGGFKGFFKNFWGRSKTEQTDGPEAAVSPEPSRPPAEAGDMPAAQLSYDDAPARRPYGNAQIAANNAADAVALREAREETHTGEEQDTKDENVLPAGGNQLYELYCRTRGLPVVLDETAVFNLSTFMEFSAPPDAEQRGWLNGFDRQARELLAKRRDEEEAPVDAQILVKLTSDKMSAWVFIMPPLFFGKEPTPDDIMIALNEAGVLFGVDEEKLADICRADTFLKLYHVARGLLPIDGENGQVVDHYHRDSEIKLTVKEDNTIDYKDLGWLQTINTDEVICDLTPPTSATPGRDVLGNERPGKDGRKANAPKGQGTKLDEDESHLVAAQDGVVSFQSDRFRVDPLLIIEGNVSTSVGNLNVIGDVLVKGDVTEGFTVQATGNITIQGMVEGAHVLSGRDIQVGRGMNGNSHGIMQAKGEIRCKFIENATVTASKDIICDTIINSTVSSDTRIQVTTGRGAIIGGQITALERIDAISVGNQSNRNIIINMGATANFLRDKQDLEEKRIDLRSSIAEITKNISYLETGSDSQTDKVLGLADDFKLKLSVQKMQLANVERQLSEMNSKQTDNKTCRLRAEALYPPAQITIGHVTKIIRQMYFSALVYLKDGDVHVGNL